MTNKPLLSVGLVFIIFLTLPFSLKVAAEEQETTHKILSIAYPDMAGATVNDGPVTLEAVLDEYINIALANNPDIAMVRARSEQADADRREAKSAFFPKISFQSRYSVAEGGRKIIIDVNRFAGNLFPGLQFPVIEESFLRPHEQETKFNVTQMLFAGGAILNNYNAVDSLHNAALCELETAERNKRFEVAEAYLNYLKAVQLVKIKENVLKLSRDGLELTEALFNQDKLLKNDVMRAQVNVSKAESDLVDSEQQKRLAQRFFNNLLNRTPFEEIKEIEVGPEQAEALDVFKEPDGKGSDEKLASFEDSALENRSEIAGLVFATDASQKFKNAAFSDYLPKIILSVDYGWQGEEYSFTKEDDYYMASLVFQWNLFDGGGREARMEKAAQRLVELKLRQESVKRSIGLQVEQAFLKLKSARKQIKTATQQFESAQENYRIVQKRYALGMALPLDMNDALAQLDIAGSTRVIALYDYIISIERMKNVLGSKYGAMK